MTGRELYEYYEREVDRDDYIDYMIEEELVDVDESMIDTYREYLEEHNRNEIYDDLDEILKGYSPKEVIETINFDGFDINDGYFRFDGFDCVESVSEWDLVYEMEEDTEFLRWYIDVADVIDENEMEKVLDEANKIAEEEEEEYDEEMREL